MKLDINCQKNTALSRCVASFNEFLRDNSLKDLILSKGVVVGLSGGADSVLLLYFMKSISQKYGIYIAAAHVNHKIRPGEAERDEEFCRRICEAWGIDFRLCVEDVPAFADKYGLGLEEAARDVRYKFFSSLIASDSRLDFVATAHNADDNLETIILNLVRGSGTKGLAGIPPVRENVIRPLLYLNKSDILLALRELGVEHITDSTNFDCDIKRNFVRNRILPLLEEISENPQKSATRASKCLRFDSNALDAMASERLEEATAVDMNDRACLIRHRLLNLPEGIAYRVISLAAERDLRRGVSLEYCHVASILESCASNEKYFSISLPGGLRAIGEGECIRFEIADDVCEKSRDYNIALKLGENIIPGVGILYLSNEPIAELEKKSARYSNNCDIFSEKSLRENKFANSITNVYKIFIQADFTSAKIIGSLYARNRCNGDSYKYGGINRSVKKLFSDRKIPLNMRDELPIICDENGIVWIPGFGVRDEIGDYKLSQIKEHGPYAYFCYGQR